jgi:hypothetical protein
MVIPVETVLAWQSATWQVNDSLHALGAFVTSSGAAGFAALGAATIAAIQVKRTRDADITVRNKLQEAEEKQRQLEAVWDRFQWVVEHAIEGENGRPPLYKPATAIDLLGQLRDAAQTYAIGLTPAQALDPRLARLIGATLANLVISAGQKAGL